MPSGSSVQLSKRQLNRTLLARQYLLTRQQTSVVEAIRHLVGLQAQIPDPPYIGLWTRLDSFQRDDLTRLMEQRQVVRVAMMRSTLQVMLAEDHQTFRMTLQPALTRALRAFYGKRAEGLDIERLIAVARPFLDEAPRSTGELRQRLLELEPDRDGPALAYAVRNFLPLVQVPPGGTWGTGTRASYATAESYLGPLNPEPDLRGLLHRYLAAFGPATIMDFQAWSGMVSLKKQIEALKAELQT
ncbi:MAG: winged helix DNA-binding domain-containing protein, partial [Chloroflexi bacterium]|nr:winged helix DNA-binding domain-containing protein [Chloroflexota bacterium]